MTLDHITVTYLKGQGNYEICQISHLRTKKSNSSMQKHVNDLELAKKWSFTFITSSSTPFYHAS